MRVLYIDAMKAQHAKSNTNGLKKAFSKVASVDLFDYRTLASISNPQSMNKALFKTVKHSKPDLIFIGKGECIFGDTVALIKQHFPNTFIVSFLGDFYWEPADFKIGQCQHADLNLFSYYDESIRNLYKKTGVKNIGYWNDGFDPEVEKKVNVLKDVEVSFFGSNYLKINNYLENYQFRYNLMSAIDKKFNLVVYGKGWENFRNRRNWVTEDKKTEAVNRSKITIGVTAVDNAYLYLSWPRVFQTMACGTLHITQYVPGLEQIFKNKEHLVWFRTLNECLELIEYYLKNDDERERIAETGRNFVLKNHTYSNRVNGFIDMKIKNENNIYDYLGVTEDYLNW